MADDEYSMLLDPRRPWGRLPSPPPQTVPGSRLARLGMGGASASDGLPESWDTSLPGYLAGDLRRPSLLSRLSSARRLVPLPPAQVPLPTSSGRVPLPPVSDRTPLLAIHTALLSQPPPQAYPSDYPGLPDGRHAEGISALSSGGVCRPAPANTQAFVQAHKADADQLSRESGGVPGEYILGLSGWESQWGQNRFVRDGNNYYSLHGEASAPHAMGFMRAGNPPYAHLSTFPSYIEAGRSFLEQYGRGLPQAKTPEDFAKQLIANKFNSGRRPGGNPHFVQNTATGIDMVRRAEQCR